MEKDYQAIDIMHAAAKAMGAVVAYYNELSTIATGATIGPDQVRLVWFSKTIQNFKALIATTLDDNLYYEVTYDGIKKITYVDCYQKVDQVAIRDVDADLDPEPDDGGRMMGSLYPEGVAKEDLDPDYSRPLPKLDYDNLQPKHRGDIGD